LGERREEEPQTDWERAVNALKVQAKGLVEDRTVKTQHWRDWIKRHPEIDDRDGRKQIALLWIHLADTDVFVLQMAVAFADVDLILSKSIRQTISPEVEEARSRRIAEQLLERIRQTYRQEVPEPPLDPRKYG
jgi:hypothetical protein